METKQAKILKRELEKEIFNLLCKYEESSCLSIKYVNTHCSKTLSGSSRVEAVTVDVEL